MSSIENTVKLKELKIFEKVIFEFKDGWTDLIYNLGKDITELCELTNCELPHIQQIKEKMGTLKFYYNCLNSPYPEIVEKSIRALVRQAESKSANICETCGKWGELRVSKRGLYFTVCEEHKEDSITSKEYEELKKERNPFRFKKNRDNWYADELLELVAHIQEHAENKDISKAEYCEMLDGVIRRANLIKDKMLEDKELVIFNPKSLENERKTN